MGKHKGSPLQAQNGSSSNSLQTLDKSKKEDRKTTKAPPSLKQRIWAKIEASLWVISAIVAAIYGDGHSNLPGLLLHDRRIRRCDHKAKAFCTSSSETETCLSLTELIPLPLFCSSYKIYAPLKVGAMAQDKSADWHWTPGDQLCFQRVPQSLVSLVFVEQDITHATCTFWQSSIPCTHVNGASWTWTDAAVNHIVCREFVHAM